MPLALLAGAVAAFFALPASGDPFLSEYLGTGYLAPFIVLVLCGFGLPIPEEITMLGAGFLVHRGEVAFLPIVLVCIAGTLIGDTVPYFVGRRWGRQALRRRSVRRAVHPERLRSIERRFERSGLWAVFVCRFLPGVRLPAWFTAGTLGIPYLKFILVDALGAAILVPLAVALGRASGEQISALEQRVEGFTHILGFVAVALAAGIAIHIAVNHKPRRGLGLGRASTRGRRATDRAPLERPGGVEPEGPARRDD